MPHPTNTRQASDPSAFPGFSDAGSNDRSTQKVNCSSRSRFSRRGPNRPLRITITSRFRHIHPHALGRVQIWRYPCSLNSGELGPDAVAYVTSNDGNLAAVVYNEMFRSPQSRIRSSLAIPTLSSGDRNSRGSMAGVVQRGLTVAKCNGCSYCTATRILSRCSYSNRRLARDLKMWGSPGGMGFRTDLRPLP
jgi:hypothetical protein